MNRNNIERATIGNRDYRRIWRTGKHMQVVLMCLHPGESVPWELHSDVDQFIRVEAGELTLMKRVGDQISQLVLRDGDAEIIEAGVEHQLINEAPRSFARFYTIYSTIEHERGLVQERQP